MHYTVGELAIMQKSLGKGPLEDLTYTNGQWLSQRGFPIPIDRPGECERYFFGRCRNIQ